MATVTKPIALDESLNTTELSSRNVADVLAQELQAVAGAIGGIAVPSADHVSYDNSVSGLSATDVQNALDEIVSDIPTVNNGTLTIQQNGTSKGSFTANSASNVNVNIETPTADKKTATDQFSTANGGLLSKCMIDLVPVQDLHGYDNPWAGGASKNKMPLTIENLKAWNMGTWNGNKYTYLNIDFTILTDDANNVIGIEENGTTSSYPSFKIFSGTLNGSYKLCKNGARARVYVNDSQVNDGYDDYSFTASGETYEIKLFTGAGTLNHKIVKPMLVLSTETDYTFAPYSNICPISGHTEVDLRNEKTDILIGASWVDDAYIDASGNVTANGAYKYISTYIKVEPNTKYTAHVYQTVSANLGISVPYYNENKGFISRELLTLTTSAGEYIVSFTTPNNCEYIRFSVPKQSNDISIQEGEWVRNIYTVQIGSTVYGGYVDAVSGVMIVTQKSYQYSDAPVPTTKDDKNRWSFSHILSDALSDMKGKKWDINADYEWYSSELLIKVESSAVVGESTCSFYGHSSSVEYRPRIADTYTAEQAQQIVRDNVIVYQINPYIIQLTPQQIEALVGQNNLSTPLSGQSIETNGVEYKELFTFADVKEYVDKKIPDAPTTDGTYTLQAVVSGGVPTYSWT